MNSAHIKRVVHKLALEYNLTDEEVREIVSYQYKFLKKIISSGSKKLLDYKTFRITNMGAFYVPKGRIEQQKRLFFNEEENFSSRGSEQ